MLTVTQAAQKIINRRTHTRGVTRQRVVAMIASGVLSAEKDPHGFYLISEAEIARVNRRQRKSGRPAGES